MKKCVLITGASRGIGKAIAIEFAKHGYSLVLNCHRSEKLLLELKQSLQTSYGTEILASVGDIGDFAYVSHLFKEIKAQFGGVDIAVNNAGISHIGLLTDMTPDEWQNIINTNLSSVFYTAKLAVPYMVSKQCGKIINISSVWGNAGASCEVAYSATKGGVNAFTKALAKELAPSHIQVNAIACGCIDTEMNHCFSPEERMALEEEIPAGRFGTAEEVAKLAFSLASGHNYLTGQIITLDGGWM
uniref:elongation factor P 5-aminopentanone reductase n=1 Tax=Agathobacter sp. TaxID=2021311 RepID=UPI004055C645